MGHESELRRYADYKDSALPWLGAIPAHWDVRRNGRLFAQRRQSGFPDLPILEVSLRTGVQVRNFETSNRKQMMSDLAGYLRAAQGDIAYNMMRLWQGAVGVAPVDGLVSPAYVVARPFPESDTGYFAYLFRTAAYMNEVNKFSRGIVADRNRLYWDEFKQMPSPFPPPKEQREIAAYLDAHGRKVQQLVRAKRRLIDLLTEQKQAIIHRAVTRGLDPTVRVKDSGVEWLGEVPEHWDVRPIKHVAQVRLSGIDKVAVEGEESVLLCNYVDIYRNDYITREIDFMRSTAKPSEIERFSLRRGDVLITKDSELWNDIAVPAVVTEELEGVVCGYHLALIRPTETALVGEFLFCCLSASSIVEQLHVAATGVIRFGLAKQDIKDAAIPVPPIEEQRHVCAFIGEQTRDLAIVMERAKREIDLIREYRTRLIADVVTGKLDVRGVELAALDEPVPLYDLETADDADEDELLAAAEEEAVYAVD